MSLSIDTSKIGLFGCSAGGLTLTHLMMTDYGAWDVKAKLHITCHKNFVRTLPFFGCVGSDALSQVPL